MLAFTYPILSIFWTMLIFFGFVIWVYLLIAVFADLFRSKDIGGFAKAMWVVALLFFPVLGLLAYLIVRGRAMQERVVATAQAKEAEFQRYVREVASAPAPPVRGALDPIATADALTRLSTLRDEGKITSEEFQQQKEKMLAS